MIEVEEALAIVLSHASALPSVSVSIDAAVDAVLAREIVSDIHSPPYDKSMMDGFALRAEDITAPATVLRVAQSIMAGDVPGNSNAPGTASRIMTGAPIPASADAVVMREMTEVEEGTAGETVRIMQHPVSVGQNIMRRGSALEPGKVVFAGGHVVRPVDVGVLAELGCATVNVTRPSKLAVMTTGNELVAYDRTPAAGQIRNSNSPMLVALGRQAGADVTDLGVGRDDVAELTRLTQQGLDSDVLVISGGVSAGDLDLMPQVLASLNVKERFHKVRIKPGKPLWFGLAPTGTLVFGLPGNPVSSLVCFYVFVKPALRVLSGVVDARLPLEPGRLEEPFEYRGRRRTFLPAKMSATTCAEAKLTIIPWKGSADLAAIAGADCLVDLPPEPVSLSAGEPVAFLKL